MSFFIDRPIFACVLSLVFLLAGGLAFFGLPIAQYPEVAPPTISVTAIYPGASAKLVSDSVASTIEQQLFGVEHKLYMSAQCTNDGRMELTVTFEVGTDLDLAQVSVQNRVSLALPKLPQAVRDQGVNVKKKSPSIILCVNLVSPDKSRDVDYLSNYASRQIKDVLADVKGVGDVTFLGEREYSMRIWLDPKALASRKLSPGDLIAAIKAHNSVVPAGQLGAQPTPSGTAFQYPLQTQGQLSDEQQFKEIVVKSEPGAKLTTLGQVSRVELGAKNYDVETTLDGQPSITLAVFQLPGSNALDTAHGVRAAMENLAGRFPPGVGYQIVYDTTPFIDESIHEVEKALRDAVILVAIVVLVFLQSWRASIIPLLAVPVAIIGTFAALAALGFSLNNLSLFGLVLAIGIVVDDAIVVVENVEHHMAHGLAPKEATRKAMQEVAGPIIATTLVLCAVFIPTAFVPGLTGQFYRQFAITIAISTLISSINSLTLTPALCPILLRPRGEARDPLTRLLNLTLGWFFSGFNRVFDVTTGGYMRAVKLLVRGSIVSLLVYGGLLFGTYLGFSRASFGFVPSQDKGYLLLNVQLPDGASLERTRRLLQRIDQVVLKTEGVDHTIAIAGQSMVANAVGSNMASMFVILKPFEYRVHHGGLHADQVLAELRRECDQELVRDPTLEQAPIAIFGAPPVDGLGNAGGFKLMIEDRGNQELEFLEGMTQNVIESAARRGGVVGLMTTFRASAPQYYIDVNRVRASATGVPLDEIYNTLGVFLGSRYVNDFLLEGRNLQVNLQADAPFRADESAIRSLQVRSKSGAMVPLSALLLNRQRTASGLQETFGPPVVTRYNGHPAAPINGAPAPGVSSGTGLRLMETTALDELPPSMAAEWTELSYLQAAQGNTAVVVFSLAVVLVFLVLAAQYESWSLPLAVILIVPMCLLSALIGIEARAMDINIFTQIGLVVLVGLASKNAILIVEFARAQQEAGRSGFDATMEACRLRLRPILMTSFAFILGVVPLVISRGAGAEMRQTLGTAVFAGMLGVTIFGIFLTPVFYFVVQWLTGGSGEKPASS
jgi:multidrug efflux pump